MAVDCVEEPGEGQAEDGAQEERSNHNLLLKRCHKRHVGPEHVHDPQTQEEQATCPHTHTVEREKGKQRLEMRVDKDSLKLF